MKDYVSRAINVLLLCASLLVVGGVFLPTFPVSTLVFASVAASFALWMASRGATRSTSQVLWDAEAEPVRVAAHAPRPGPAPKTTL